MIDRIRQTIEYSQLSASAFADTIGISRSGLTHLLTGRNQPSLDVARKILAKYPEISTEWLIMGMGDMLRSDETDVQQPVTVGPAEGIAEHRVENSKLGSQPDLFAEFDTSDGSDGDVDEETVAEESVEDVEISEDETDTENAPIEESVSAPVESPTPAELTPAPQPRQRKSAPVAKPVSARRERHVPAPEPAQEKKLRKIVFFYDDHSFEVYNG